MSGSSSRFTKVSPRHLVHGEAGSFGRDLLVAARSDGPSRRRSAAAIAAAVATSSSTADASAKGDVSARSGSTTPAAPTSATSSLLVKGVVGMALAGGLVFALSYAQSTLAPPVATVASPTLPVTHDAPAAAVPIAEPTMERTESTVSVHDLPTVPSAAPPVRGRAVASVQSPTKPLPSGPDAPLDSIDAELASLRRARAFLRDGDPAKALDELARYAARWQEGKLAPEADALTVDAEIAAGHPDTARKRAAIFLEKHGDSPLAPRVRKLRDGLGAR